MTDHNSQAKKMFNKFRKVLLGEEFIQLINNQQTMQRVLNLQYADMKKQNFIPDFSNTGFRVYSQTDEDGLLLFIFSMIGMGEKLCIELGSGTPIGANSTNLICNWGWKGLLVDGNKQAIDRSNTFYETHMDTWLNPPKIIHSWITAENVNKIIEDHGFGKKVVDLLSLDLDGIDYWIWNSLDLISPRVIILEYQDFWEPEQSVTVPYSSDFVCPDQEHLYCSASLSAFIKLGKEKGYRLIGFNRLFFNAFFIRNDLGCEWFPEIPVEQGLNHPERLEKRSEKEVIMAGRPWIEV